MRRRIIFGVTFLAVVAGAFIVTGFAIGSDRTSPPAFPALALPPTDLSESTRVDLSDDIGPLAADVGITTGSYSSVRVIGSTSVGNLFLVPGTRGACLVLDHAVSCGNPNTGDNHFVTLFDIDPTVGLIGGGITAAGVSTISFPANGNDMEVPVTNGTFIVDGIPHASGQWPIPGS